MSFCQHGARTCRVGRRRIGEYSLDAGHGDRHRGDADYRDCRRGPGRGVGRNRVLIRRACPAISIHQCAGVGVPWPIRAVVDLQRRRRSEHRSCQRPAGCYQRAIRCGVHRECARQVQDCGGADAAPGRHGRKRWSVPATVRQHECQPAGAARRHICEPGAVAAPVPRQPAGLRPEGLRGHPKFHPELPRKCARRHSSVLRAPGGV